MSNQQQALLTGAVVTGLLSVSYLGLINVLCCLGVIIGGAVAVQRYVTLEGTGVDTGDGAVLGAGAGAAGSILGTVFDRLLRPLDLDGQSLAMDAFQQLLDPQAYEQVRQQMEGQQDPGAFALVLSLLLGAVLYAVFGAIGGAIGAALFSNEDA
jgi:hypothetical protein